MNPFTQMEHAVNKKNNWSQGANTRRHTRMRYLI